MKLKDLRTHFSESLEHLYPHEEAQSFFTILSEAILKYSRLDLSLNKDEVVSELKVSKFMDAMERLLQHEPVQYIVGSTEFYSLPFKVTSATLIPRPETEELVDWIITDRNISSSPSNGDTKILDVGTGSGCIAISLAKNIVGAEVSAVDISEEALKVSQENAQSNGVSVRFQQLDILRAEKLEQSYHIIVSNPPYVRELEKKEMQPNVLEHEPAKALFVSNTNPLVFYNKIAQLSYAALKPGGKLFLEINEYLGKEMIAMLRNVGFTKIEMRKDIFKKDRMIKCIKDE